MADKDMQSSQSFSQTAAGGVMARVAKVAAVRGDDCADVGSDYYVSTFLYLQSQQSPCKQLDLWQ